VFIARDADSETFDGAPSSPWRLVELNFHGLFHGRAASASSRTAGRYERKLRRDPADEGSIQGRIAWPQRGA